MAKLFNLARMTTATTGTGTVTLGSAVSGHISFASTGVANGDVVSYAIIDGTAAEVGTGTYTSSGTTLSRTLVNSTTGSLLNLSGSAEVFIADLAADHLPYDSLSAPGAFLGKNLSNSPLWLRSNSYSENRNFLSGFSDGTGADAPGTVDSTNYLTADGLGYELSTGTTTSGGAVGQQFYIDDTRLVPFHPGTVLSGFIRPLDAVSDGTNGYRWSFGLTRDRPFGSEGDNEMRFLCDFATYGNQNIRAISRASATSTTTDTGVASTAGGLQKLVIAYDTTSQIRYWINGALVATHTTNIPGASVDSVPFCATIRKTAGTSARRLRYANILWQRYY